ncbi:DNA-directed RNA polymerase subunit beta [bacterium]|nr:DNA-directed RNA polymerase subunit beta [bacterium]
MAGVRRGKPVLRKSFGRIREVVSLPDLIEVQSKSFNDFVQLDYLPSERKKVGLEKVFRDVFPIEHGEKISLEYVSYELGTWACACGKLSGFENRYKWKCTKCKGAGVNRLSGKECPKCKNKTASYVRCGGCHARVTVKVEASVDECYYGDKVYSMPLRAKMQLIAWDNDPETGERTIHDVKEQEVFFCDLPVMIDFYENDKGRIELGSKGTFLINGVYRVVVSQIHRAPGILFSLSKRNKDFRGNPVNIARIIPARGAWLDFEFDQNDILYARIDKKKKILATTLLQSIGVSRKEMLPLFYKFEDIEVEKGDFYKVVNDSLIGQRLDAGAVPEKHAEGFTVGQRITPQVIEKLKKGGVRRLKLRKSSLVNRIASGDVTDASTGELLLKRGGTIKAELVDHLEGVGKCHFALIQHSGYVFQPSIALTLDQDSCETYEDAVKDVYSRLRPGDVSSFKIMEEYIQNMFFNQRFYDLTIVGRIRINRKLGSNVSEEITHLRKEDIVDVLRYLVSLKERGEGELDDVDNMGNRCVRLVGELLQSQIYVGLSRVEKVVRERLRLQENYTALMPYDFINVKPLAAVLREFFGAGQLSQFMDQTNPLAEMAHKRRLSALGPGGITRERATLEVRDVHPSHYGRICPIETPEGQNIGLIASLATYAKVNPLGFIETTYRPVEDGVIKDEVVTIDAFQELGKSVGQATVDVDEKGKIKSDEILARRSGNVEKISPKDLSYVEASPRQMVSVATALIPFLEHDDANRALMGSNMQRQAVPLVNPKSPLVGTGMEREIGNSEGSVIAAKASGIVRYVASDKVVILRDAVSDPEKEEEWFSHPVDSYVLKKFGKSGHDTCVHYTPTVKAGMRVEKGDVVAHGPSISDGELALGCNLLAAFIPWYGYNFEDAIVMSQRLVAEDVLTSVHVEEFTVEARDTKLGAEEITRDIPNVSEKELEALDDDGIVRVGTRVKPGDILVGKVTLKGDVQVSPEEKLLRAIFGEKSREVRDTSSRVKPGINGTVVDVKIFSRSGIRRDKRYKEIVIAETEKLEIAHVYQVGLIEEAIKEKLVTELAGNSAGKCKELSDGGKFSATKIKDASIDVLLKIKSGVKAIDERSSSLREIFDGQLRVLEALKAEKIAKLRKGDDLPSGVIKRVCVSVAMKRHISVGDKVAGRHGNKGVVSRIVNKEDMPYLADGRSVDIVLNPLGVPGRMNVGQLLETVLGMACKTIGNNLADKINEWGASEVKKYLEKYYGKELVANIEETYGQDGLMDAARKVAEDGCKVSTPIFDGADFEKDVTPLLKSLNIPDRGVYQLHDGQTGELMDQPVTVGQIYMMKLNHLADDKLHARSVGPCSLITQQPLGGKAQFGGQRLGEMEGWALYGYGAAHTLQEMLTIKSDDVNGRLKAYEAIVRGDELPTPGMPESFNVLIKELQSLGLQVDPFRASKEQTSE